MEASACVKGAKIRCYWSAAMPMPVSETENRMVKRGIRAGGLGGAGGADARRGLSQPGLAAFLRKAVKILIAPRQKMP